MDFPLKVPFPRRLGALSTCLVTSILFQFIYLVTHRSSTLGLPGVGTQQIGRTEVRIQERAIILAIRSPLL